MRSDFKREIKGPENCRGIAFYATDPDSIPSNQYGLLNLLGVVLWVC